MLTSRFEINLDTNRRLLLLLLLLPPPSQVAKLPLLPPKGRRKESRNALSFLLANGATLALYEHPWDTRAASCGRSIGRESVPCLMCMHIHDKP